MVHKEASPYRKSRKQTADIDFENHCDEEFGEETKNSRGHNHVRSRRISVKDDMMSHSDEGGYANRAFR
jgi:hypothetical protein